MDNQAQQTFVSKAEAAALLGLSGRRTADYAQRGFIERRTVLDQKLKRMVSLFKLADVERLAKEIKDGAIRPGLTAQSSAALAAASSGQTTGALPSEVSGPPLVLRGAGFSPVVDGAQRLRASLQAQALENRIDAGIMEALTRFHAEREWLTLAEAEIFSGLPERFLKKCIRSGELPARNVGRGSVGGAYRVRREDLKKLQPGKPAKRRKR